MQERTITIRDGMFSAQVREYGAASAEPLLFLHGSGGPMPDRYLDLLAERFHVLAPEHPGYGDSTGLEHLDDIVDFALYYYDLMDVAGIESAHVVGHSLGGMLAAEIAALDPHRVRKLVLANPIGLWRDDAPTLDFFSADPQTLMEAIWFDPVGEVASARRPPNMDDMEKLMEYMYASMQSLSAAAKFQWPLPDKGLSKRIHRIKAPTLILWGEKDGLVPPVYAEEFRTRIRDSRVVILKQAAHMTMLEQPDEFASVILEFLGG